MNKNKEKLWSLPFILLLISHSLNLIITYMMNPVFTQYLSEKGVIFSLTGILSSILSWIAMVIRPFAGAASDRFDRKKMMIFSYLASAVCLYCYSIADSLWQIVLIRVIHGIIFGISGTVSMALASSYVPISRMAEGVGYVALASLMGNLFGPYLGSLITDNYSIKVLFMICSVLSIICGLIVTVVPYHNVHNSVSKKEKLSFSDFFMKELIIYVVLIGLFSVGNGIISYYLKLMGNERGIENISLFFTVYALSMLVVKPFAGKLQDKVGISMIIYPSLILFAIGIMILARAYTLKLVLLAAVLKAIGQGCGSPAIQAEAIKQSGKEKSGVASSTIMIGQDLGNAMGPIYAGMVIPLLDYQGMYDILAILLVVGCVIYYFYSRKAKEN